MKSTFIRSGLGFAAVVAAALHSPRASAESVLIDFESPHFTRGQPAEGPGVMLHPYLAVSTTTGRATVVGPSGSGEPLACTYGAPNTLGYPCGCMGNPGGFSSSGSLYGQGLADMGGVHHYTFTFAPEIAASEFSILMLDFGDFNPTLATSHKIEVVARDGSGGIIATDTLAFTSTPVVNPPEYWQSGDACMAQPGQYGNYTFSVRDPGGLDRIKSVTLVVDPVGRDPNIAFDNISFTTCGDADHDGVSDCVDLCLDTRIPESVPTDGRLNPNHFALIDNDRIFDPAGNPTYTLDDTKGCSCEQILDALHKGDGERRRGCSAGTMAEWIKLVSGP